MNWESLVFRHLVEIDCSLSDCLQCLFFHPMTQDGREKNATFNMLSVENLNSIKLIRCKRIACVQFPSKQWNPHTVNHSVRKCVKTESIRRKPGTGLENESFTTD